MQQIIINTQSNPSAINLLVSRGLGYQIGEPARYSGYDYPPFYLFRAVAVKRMFHLQHRSQL